ASGVAAPSSGCWSSVRRRRRSGPVITSALAIAPPLAPVQAPSLALMLDYQPETVLRRKAALTGGKRKNSYSGPASQQARFAHFSPTTALFQRLNDMLQRPSSRQRSAN